QSAPLPPLNRHVGEHPGQATENGAEDTEGHRHDTERGVLGEQPRLVAAEQRDQTADDHPEDRARGDEGGEVGRAAAVHVDHDTSYAVRGSSTGAPGGRDVPWWVCATGTRTRTSTAPATSAAGNTPHA